MHRGNHSVDRPGNSKHETGIKFCPLPSPNTRNNHVVSSESITHYLRACRHAADSNARAASRSLSSAQAQFPPAVVEQETRKALPLSLDVSPARMGSVCLVIARIYLIT